MVFLLLGRLEDIQKLISNKDGIAQKTLNEGLINAVRLGKDKKFYLTKFMIREYR